ncbi:MAG: type III secretion system chaperone [Planctomycetota bacterium]
MEESNENVFGGNVLSTFEHIQTLVADVGPLVEAIETIEELSEHRWGVACSDDLMIEIECLQAANRLSFLVSIGAVRDINETEVYRTLLSYNILWRENGGVHMALDQEGEVALLADIYHLDLTLETLVEILERLIDSASAWRQFLSKASDSPPDSSDTELGSNAIKV